MCDINKNQDNLSTAVTLCLSDKGIRLLLGEAADAFIRKNNCANKYEFLKKIDDLVDDMPHHPKLFDYRRLLRDVRNLDGILIATTNLASNLDGAFQRRFLFKVRFDKPTTESKKHIWRSKLPDFTDAEATELAANFNFSGGEIDNIVRKATMHEVISGTIPTIENLKTLCNEEKIASKTAKVGF